MKRRHLLWGVVVAAVGAMAVGSVAVILKLPEILRTLFLPRSTLEPSTTTKIGRLTDFAVGVSNKYQQEYRITVVRNRERLYVLYAKCTHLGCTPDWHESEGEFKCPCHGSHFCMGSAFDRNGLNCGGPAVRPLDRVYVEVNSDGEIVVNTNKLFQWPQNGRSEFDDAGAFIPLPKI